MSAAGVVVAGASVGARGPVCSTSRGAQDEYAGNKSAQFSFRDAARTDGNRAQNTSQQIHNTGVMPQPLAGVIEESSSSSPAPSVSAAAMVGAGAVTSGTTSDMQLYHMD